jgi:ACR3 family arsenite transporter
MKDVTESVLIYLGIPFLAGFISRYTLVKSKGIEWYNRKFVPNIAHYIICFTVYNRINVQSERR